MSGSRDITVILYALWVAEPPDLVFLVHLLGRTVMANSRAEKRHPLRSRRKQLRLELLESRLCLAAEAAFLPGEVLIQFDASTSDAVRAEVRGRADAKLAQRIHTPPMRAVGLGSIDRVTLPGNVPVHAAIKMFEANPHVMVAEPNYIIESAEISNDPRYTNGSLWGMESDDSPLDVGPAGTTNIFGSQAEEAWNAGATGSSSVYVGIIDEGFQYSHEDLSGNAWVNSIEQNGTAGVDDDGNGYVDDIYGWDFYNNDNTPYDGSGDDHGTHVAGTIGGEGGNGLGVAGVNWDVTMISAKFLGPSSGSTSGAIAAVDYITDLKARHNIDIVATNNSWGGGGYSSLLEAAIIRGANADILFIAAAGNNSSDIDASAYYPASYSTLTPQGSGNAPASYEGVISVASITSSGALSSFSNYGATRVDIAAPGSGIYSTLPGDTYGSYNGTSMATPHVAGAAALFASQFPEGTRPSGAEIRDALMQSAVPTSSVTGKTVSGGRLDVNAALSLANPPGVDVSIVATPQSEQTEGDSGTKAFNFEIRLDQPALTNDPIEVDYQLEYVGGATADDFDFSTYPANGTVTFSDPMNSAALVQVVTIEVAGDVDVEPDESFNVVIPQAPSNAGLWLAEATGTIWGDDASIMGIVWNDSDQDGSFDTGETGLGGVIVFLDENNDGNLNAGETSFVTAADGQYEFMVAPETYSVRLALSSGQTQTSPLNLSGSLDPDGFADGTILNDELSPSVQLSAVGNSIANANVTAETGTYPSTGAKVFASTWNGGLWNTVDAELRVDFSSKVNSVSVDVISDDSSDYGHLRAYDQNGNLLQEYVSGNLGTGVAETMTVTRSSNEISYVLASGRQGQFAWLDNLAYSSIDDGTNAAIRVVVGPEISSGHNFGVVYDGTPSAVDDATNTNEDTPVAISVLLNDSDPNGDTLSVTGVAGIDNGTVDNNDNVLTFTPASNYFGVEEFTYTISDGNGGTNSATVTVTVVAVNDVPEANADNYEMGSGSTLTVSALGVLANDMDVDGDSLSAVLVSSVSDGTLGWNGDGGFTYTPNPTFSGNDSFSYAASDGSANSNTVTVTIHVNGTPVSVNDSYSVDEDAALNAAAPGVLGNDSDPENDSIIAILVGDVSNGSLTLNANGSFNYTPNANFDGTDSFTYKATDGVTDSAVATVTLSLNPINDAPAAVDDEYSVNEGASLVVAAPGVIANDNDIDGDSLTAAVVTPPVNGSLSFLADGSFTYTPDPAFTGADSFTYRVNDGLADSAPAAVSITVNSLGPIALFADGFESGAFTEGGWLVASTPAAVDGTGAFTGSFGAHLKKQASIEKSLSTVGYENVQLEYARRTRSLESGEFLFVEWFDGNLWSQVESTQAGTWGVSLIDLGASAENNADFKIRFRGNGNGGNDAVMVDDVAVIGTPLGPPNDAPQTSGDAFEVNEDQTLTVAAPGILHNDDDLNNDSLSAVRKSDPSHGTLTLAADGSFVYTPNPNYAGPDSFTYAANDGVEDGNVATVTLTVTQINDAPVAVDDSYSTPQDAPLTVTAPGVLSNDSDIENDTLVAMQLSEPVQGTVVWNGSNDGSFTYTPNTDASGSDSFTYKVSDGLLESNVATVTITINAVPVAVDDTLSVSEDESVTLAAPGILENDIDGDGDSLTAVLVSDVSNGTLALQASGALTYTPNANFNGADSFTYRASDGTADSGLATVTISVDAVNDAPIASDDSYSLDQDTTLTVAVPGVLANDSDVDGDALQAILVTGPVSGTLSLNLDGSFSYQPDQGFAGTDSFTYFAEDAAEVGDEATVTLTVNATANLAVTGMSPNVISLGSTENVVITGVGFISGATVTLENGSGPAPGITNVQVVDPNTITARIRVRSGGPNRNRVWDVRVTNPDNSTAVLLDGLTVTVNGGANALRVSNLPDDHDHDHDPIRTELNSEMLQQATHQAIEYWLASGLPAHELEHLLDVDVHVEDLGGTFLGLAGHDRVWIDDDAATHGWNVGHGRIDLAAVIAHEFGHLLGFDHDHSDPIMAAEMLADHQVGEIDPEAHQAATWPDPSLLRMQATDGVFQHLARASADWYQGNVGLGQLVSKDLGSTPVARVIPALLASPVQRIDRTAASNDSGAEKTEVNQKDQAADGLFSEDFREIWEWLSE